MRNLNDVMPEVDGYADSECTFREHGSDESAPVQAYFDHLTAHLCNRIAHAHFVAGCMAWFTNRRVLESMARLPGGCQVVVQKEDFLRPDSVERADLKSLYGALRSPHRHDLPTRTSVGPNWLSTSCSQECEAVRCMGVRPVRGRVTPKMHHKFFVFFDNAMSPFAVWTGSFNATENGAMSRENALYIRSRSIATAYAVEWSRALSLSESLDWSSDYVEPDWRFGT